MLTTLKVLICKNKSQSKCIWWQYCSRIGAQIMEDTENQEMRTAIPRRDILRTSALVAVAGAATTLVGCQTAGDLPGLTAGQPVIRMTKASLEFMTSNRSYSLGSSGTGSGGGCDTTSVHCCFGGAFRVIRVGDRYVLRVGDIDHAIEAVDNDKEVVDGLGH
jgi:hypothetical protein